MKFLEALANVFRVPDLRKRLLFTLGLLAVYRLGAFIPTPGVDTVRLNEFFQQNSGTLFGFIDLFSGGTFRRFTIFALGIMPYITASIILQLLTVVVPTLEKLQKEGELGRRKITQWTRYLTVILAGMQSFGIATLLQNAQQGFVTNPGFGFIVLTMVSLTTGTAFIMWLGEQITERGIGNGMSLIIFTGIVVGLPRAIEEIVMKLQNGDWGVAHIIVILTMMIAVVAFIVLVERGERRIPVQYAKRVIGRRMMGGQQTHLPLKVNAGGVIPVIFASSLLAFPQTFLNIDFVKNSAFLSNLLGALGSRQPLYYLMYVVLIIFFCFFYVSILSLIPQIMIGGIALQRLPLVGNFIDAHFPRWLLDGLGVNFYFGGTSLLIVVGVAMDTVNQIEAQLIMRHYEGFTPRAGRIRGRRSTF